MEYGNPFLLYIWLRFAVIIENFAAINIFIVRSAL